MNKQNTKRLYEKYPVVFGPHKLPPSQSPMYFGFDCGNGWYDLIDRIAFFVRQENGTGQGHFSEGLVPPIQAVQVKQKFGGLRFYLNSSTDYLDGVIAMAEEMSFRICEECGSTDEVKQTEGYVRTLCKKCREEMKKALNRRLTKVQSD